MQVFRVGPLSANSYLLWDDDREALIIDAAGGVKEIIKVIGEKGLQLRYIICSHGHYDHIAANTDFQSATGAEILIHERDASYLNDTSLNLAGFFSLKFTNHKADRLLYDGEIITCGTLRLQVIHTPGHTPGGICLLVEDMLFSGDTLFARGIGRSDLIGGDGEQLLQSIDERLMVLADDIRVYPGHGEATTIGAERTQNPYLQF